MPTGSCSLPGTDRKASRFPPHKRLRPCLALLRLGVAWPLHCCNAGGLLHRLFTLALASGMSLWPCPAGSSEESPPRALPGNLLCGVRTFLDADYSTPRPSSRPVPSSYPVLTLASIIIWRTADQWEGFKSISIGKWVGASRRKGFIITLFNTEKQTDGLGTIYSFMMRE